MTGVYRQNPAVAWRYREPDRFAALPSIFVEPVTNEDPAPFLVERNARHPWLYSPDPDVDWHYYGRNFMIPLGVPQQTAIEVPAGKFTMFGRVPSTATGQIEGLVQVPMEHPSVAAYGGVYRPISNARRRFVTIAEGSPAAAASGVEINVPAGEASFSGQTANLGDTIIRVPLGELSLIGRLPTVATGGTEGISALFQAERTTATFREEDTERVFLPEDTDVREL